MDFSGDRDLSGIIFKKLGVGLGYSGPRVDFPKVQRPFSKITEVAEIRNYF
jgi:hypothetical protein